MLTLCSIRNWSIDRASQDLLSSIFFELRRLQLSINADLSLNATDDELEFQMGPKVLLVDDSGVMRKIILRALNSLEITDVREASDGAEALELFGQDRFDLVLSDWNMPRMSGLELLKAIRASASTVPFIMITTESEQGRVLEAIQAGASNYMVKPFEQELLLEKLQKYVTIQV